MMSTVLPARPPSSSASAASAARAPTFSVTSFTVTPIAAMRSTTPLPACGPDSGSTIVVPLKWPRLAPMSRAALAGSLATVTAALTTTDRGRPDPKILCGAPANWAFNTNARTAGKPKDDYASAIAWIERNSVPIDKLAETTITRAALDALTKLPSGDDRQPQALRVPSSARIRRGSQAPNREPARLG